MVRTLGCGGEVETCSHLTVDLWQNKDQNPIRPLYIRAVFFFTCEMERTLVSVSSLSQRIGQKPFRISGFGQAKSLERSDLRMARRRGLARDPWHLRGWVPRKVSGVRHRLMEFCGLRRQTWWLPKGPSLIRSGLSPARETRGNVECASVHDRVNACECV